MADVTGGEQGQCFEASRNAYSSGDGGRAHDLSMEGKQHQREKDRLNAEAAEWIYRGALVAFRSPVRTRC